MRKVPFRRRAGRTVDEPSHGTCRMSFQALQLGSCGCPTVVGRHRWVAGSEATLAAREPWG